MKKSIKFLLIILIFTSCSNSDGALLKGIKRKVIEQADIAQKNGKEYSLFKMSSVTDFKWEKFYVFDEFLSDKNISDIIGIEWNGRTVPSGNKRLLFINKGEVIRYVDLEMDSFPITFNTCEPIEQDEYKKQDDVFAVFQYCSKNGCFYELIPARCIENFLKLKQRNAR